MDNIFTDSKEIYIASADIFLKTEENIKLLVKLKYDQRKLDYFYCVIGGLAGLNYLNVINPKETIFYDINPAAVDYAKLFFNMISISDTREDFLERFFSRKLLGKISIKNQYLYLDSPPSADIFEETYIKIDEENEQLFNHIFGDIYKNPSNLNYKYCKKIFPMFPKSLDIPVETNKPDRENINTLHYGLGWLSSDDSYNRVKNSLKGAKLIVKNLFDLEIEHEDKDIIIYTSNINRFFGEEWNEFCIRMMNEKQKISAITVYDGIYFLGNGNYQLEYFIPNYKKPIRYIYRKLHRYDKLRNPHNMLLMTIRPYLKGKIVEITHRNNWGFYELKRKAVTYKQFLDHPIKSNTIILHILMSEGVTKDYFEKLIYILPEYADRVMIIEHNRNSKDWDSYPLRKKRIPSSQEIEKFIPKNKSILKLYSEGITDAVRNVIYVIDFSGNC